MRIALVNGSPKVAGSASAVLLEGIKSCLGGQAETADFSLRVLEPGNEALSGILACDALVFSLPLYVDGLPSHAVRALELLEGTARTAPPRARTAYAMVNCGFYEGEQSAVALRMLEHWCAHAGVRWGYGLGVGAGGMLTALSGAPMGRGPTKSLGRELEAMARSALVMAQGETRFVTADLPRFAYRAAAQFGWRRAVKAAGLKRGDLSARPGEGPDEAYPG